jgi:hypothetical protein
VIPTLVSLVLACNDQLGGDFPRSLADGRIHGVVTTLGGSPVDPARIRVHRRAEDTVKFEIAHSGTITNAAGEYEVDVAVVEHQYPEGIPDILPLCVIAETSGDSAVSDSVLAPVAVAEPGETFVPTAASLRLPIP